VTGADVEAKPNYVMNSVNLQEPTQFQTQNYVGAKQRYDYDITVAVGPKNQTVPHGANAIQLMESAVPTNPDPKSDPGSHFNAYA
jgi:hypothetical protein